MMHEVQIVSLLCLCGRMYVETMPSVRSCATSYSTIIILFFISRTRAVLACVMPYTRHQSYL